MGANGVVVTGLGVLACNGLGREAYWRALAEGKSGIRRVTRFDPSDLPCQIAGELQDFNPEDFLKKSEVRYWHRHVHQAVGCTKLAVADGEFEKAGYVPERVAVGIGTSVGSPNEAYDSAVEVFRTQGYKKISKLGSSAFSGHSATVHVSINLGLRGPATTIASGCTTGLDVLGWGMTQIRLGRADAAVVGATESPIFPMSYASACALGILSKRNDEPDKAMRPFDRHRDGIVLSEGAVALVLEREDRARARGARILAEVVGYGSAAEGVNPLILDRQGESLARSIEMAMRDAGVTARDIDYIESHGVSLEMYDHCEVNAYKRALGDMARRIPIGAVKSMTGQAYAAGGLLGVGSALLTLNRGIIPPILNLEDPDPECDLDFVPLRSRFNDVKTALVCSISFGGTHGAVVLRAARN